MIKSPSFSRSASSTTMTILPRRMSATTDSMLSKVFFIRRKQHSRPARKRQPQKRVSSAIHGFENAVPALFCLSRRKSWLNLGASICFDNKAESKGEAGVRTICKFDYVIRTNQPKKPADFRPETRRVCFRNVLPAACWWWARANALSPAPPKPPRICTGSGAVAECAAEFIARAAGQTDSATRPKAARR